MHGVYWTPGFPPLDPFIDLKKQYPHVPCILVFNPFSGVGTSRIDWYAREICRCKKAGIMPYGYVYTQFDARDGPTVDSEANYYKKWYYCMGIHYDELSSGTNPPTYVSNRQAYAATKSLGSVGNPGTTIAANYLGIMDNYIIAENAGLDDLSFIPVSYPGADKKNFTAVFYDVPSLTDADIEEMAQYVGYMFISERTLGQGPYFGITSYLEQLFEVLNDFPAS